VVLGGVTGVPAVTAPRIEISEIAALPDTDHYKVTQATSLLCVAAASTLWGWAHAGKVWGEG
jgi:hypothetical protein